MNRRDFIITGLTAAGLVLAAPRVALAEEKPKYTHVADMYPWDGVYRSQDEFNSSLLAKPPATLTKIIKSDIDPEKIKAIYNFFKNPEKIKRVLEQLLDNSIENDELSGLWLDPRKKLVAFRIITPDVDFAPINSTNQKDKEKYGNIQVYMTSESTNIENLQKIAQYLNIILR